MHILEVKRLASCRILSVHDRLLRIESFTVDFGDYRFHQTHY